MLLSRLRFGAFWFSEAFFKISGKEKHPKTLLSVSFLTLYLCVSIDFNYDTGMDFFIYKLLDYIQHLNSPKIVKNIVFSFHSKHFVNYEVTK